MTDAAGVVTTVAEPKGTIMDDETPAASEPMNEISMRFTCIEWAREDANRVGSHADEAFIEKRAAFYLRLVKDGPAA